VPVAVLANTSIAFFCCDRDEFKDFARGCARAENGSDAHRMKGGAIIFGNDASAKDDDIVQARFAKFLTDLREQVGVSAREGGEAQKPSVLVPYGVDDLLGGAPKARVNDLVAGIAKGAGHDFGAPIVAIKSGFGHHDAQRLVHDAWMRRFPINTTPQSRLLRRFRRASNKGGLG
jgi:hypothetical protein